MFYNTNHEKHNLSLDLLYVPSGLAGPVDFEAFRSVRINIETKADKLEVFLESPVEMTNEDLKTVIIKLQQDVLARMRINAETDCLFVLKTENKHYNVHFAGGNVTTNEC